MTILMVENLTKSYDNNSGIFNFNIDVKDNDIVLLLGPNGAGKTTAFRSILGLTTCEYDQLEVMNEPMADRKEAMNHIGAMVSKPSFYDYLTGFEYLNMLTSIYKNVDEQVVGRVLNQVGLVKAKDKRISAYSSGMKQRLDLARSIIHKPSLLILDEPFNGMDIEGKYELKQLLIDMQSKSSVGIVISSHMVGELEHFANKVIIIYDGKTLFSGEMSRVKMSGLTLEEFYLEKLNTYKSKEAKDEYIKDGIV